MVLRPQFNRLQFLLSLKLDIKGGDTPTGKVAGLPNIKGNGGSFYGGGAEAYEALIKDPVISEYGAAEVKPVSGPCRNYAFLKFDASKSNPIYGASNTVQPPAIQLIPQLRY